MPKSFHFPRQARVLRPALYVSLNCMSSMKMLKKPQIVHITSAMRKNLIILQLCILYDITRRPPIKRMTQPKMAAKMQNQPRPMMQQNTTRDGARSCSITLIMIGSKDWPDAVFYNYDGQSIRFEAYLDSEVSSSVDEELADTVGYENNEGDGKQGS